MNHFGPMIAADLRKRRLKPHSTWHLDEVYLKIDGRMVYLWRAVDVRRTFAPSRPSNRLDFFCEQSGSVVSALRHERSHPAGLRAIAGSCW